MRSKGQNWSAERRLKRLADLQRGDLHGHCADALRRVVIFGVNDVQIRPGMVAAPRWDARQPDPGPRESGPPLPLISRLIAARGMAMRLYLTALYEAQVRQRPGSVHTNERQLWPFSSDDIGWVGLLATTATVTANGRSEMGNRLRQIKSAIERLVNEGGVILPNATRPRNKFEHFLLSRDVATPPGLPVEERYVTPRRNEGISIPVQFYTNNWLHCLTDSEIALWLSLRLLAKEYPDAHSDTGIYMPDNTRRYRFGLTRDAYESHTMLRYFGLIRGVDNESRWRAGRSASLRERGRVEPLHFVLNDRALSASAVDVVSAILQQYQLE